MVHPRLYESLPLNHTRRQRRITLVSIAALAGLISGTFFLEAFHVANSYLEIPLGVTVEPLGASMMGGSTVTGLAELQAANGRPQLWPLPPAAEVWQCEVVVVGGSLGGVAAAFHAMQTGAQTCLIELSPWLGGQISSQGVSAIDESRVIRSSPSFSPSWDGFKRLIRSQVVTLPDWTGLTTPEPVHRLNNCWVGDLCFLPEAGAISSQQWLETASRKAPNSRWATATAFKGAAFDPSGRNITAIYAVQRIPRAADYAPQGRFSRELFHWYAWSSDDTFEKVPIRLEAPPEGRMVVIDATDTGELVAWSRVPHRIGSDAQSLLGEVNAPKQSNPDCTQAFTYPFVIAIADDKGASYQALQKLETGMSRAEHRRAFGMEGFPMFDNRSLFNYRRIVSFAAGPAHASPSLPGEMTLVNWNQGNDWNIMDDPLILTQEAIDEAGQRQNWMGGLSVVALQNAENHAFRFAEWLMDTQATPDRPLALLTGVKAPLGTVSGLSMLPYIREGRRIIGRPAYGQEEFMIREADLRRDMAGGRDFSPTAVGLGHYDIDIHGCRYRNWQPSFEATGAGMTEGRVRPLQIPLESMIPIGLDNVLIGGKTMAVSHIANAMTRVHQPEWSTGGAAGAIAGWLIHDGQPADLTPAQILVTDQIALVQAHLIEQGLRYQW
ncbi:FAD-dependent oxidoreductase [Leptolyngbya sp. PCC 6406]|uniref:FAD-dependent oxidoreductase n=1 Tax=Leptolyngbya sp. PCC 6406 TaxID=1173264 RepID=UPI0002ABDE59|nr:FAD-dependent oxidoreductase [Leptolyngbya sp. PCC 6406]